MGKLKWMVALLLMSCSTSTEDPIDYAAKRCKYEKDRDYIPCIQRYEFEYCTKYIFNQSKVCREARTQ